MHTDNSSCDRSTTSTANKKVSFDRNVTVHEVPSSLSSSSPSCKNTSKISNWYGIQEYQQMNHEIRKIIQRMNEETKRLKNNSSSWTSLHSLCGGKARGLEHLTQKGASTRLCRRNYAISAVLAAQQEYYNPDDIDDDDDYSSEMIALSYKQVSKQDKHDAILLAAQDRRYVQKHVIGDKVLAE